MQTAVIPQAAAPAPGKALGDALDDFLAVLSDEQRRKLRSIGAIRDPDTVMIFTAQLDRENQARKGRGISSRLGWILQAVYNFSGIVDTFVSSHPEIAALVWGSIKISLLIAVNFTSYFEALSSLFMGLSRECPRFSEYEALYPTSTRLKTALCGFHASIVRCCKHVVEATQRPWQKQLRIVFQSFEQEFQPDVDDIKRLADDVKQEIHLAKAQTDYADQALQGQERTNASELRTKLKKFMRNTEVKINNADETQLEQSRRQQIRERQRLLDSVSSYPHMNPLRESLKRHHYNTAEWIFTADEYKSWYDGTGPALLWCSGKIGSGKTITCANMIRHVLADKDCDDRVTFFFMEGNNQDSLLAETAVRSIVRQAIDITTLSADMEQALRSLLQGPFSNLKSWARTISEAAKLANTFFIFIDGLDECDAPERRAFIDALSLLTSTCPRLRILASSRDSVSLDLKQRFPQRQHISMSPDRIAPDIHLYVKSTVEQRKLDGDLAIQDESLEKLAVSRLTDHADGMFLWVKFLLDELCLATCDADVRKSLQNLPKNLEETFVRALSRILKHRPTMTKLITKVFRWMVAAKEPLSLGQLREAVSLKIGQSFLAPQSLAREMSPVALWCENLVSVTEGKPPLVQLAHRTIHDFMTQATLPDHLAMFHVDFEDMEHTAGELCVTYLHLNNLKTTVATVSKPFEIKLSPAALLGRDSGNTATNKVARSLAGIRSSYKGKVNPDIVERLSTYGTSQRQKEELERAHPFVTYASRHWISHSGDFSSQRSSTYNLWLALLHGRHDLAVVPWEVSRHWIVHPGDFSSQRSSTYNLWLALLHGRRDLAVVPREVSDNTNTMKWSLDRHHHALMKWCFDTSRGNRCEDPVHEAMLKMVVAQNDARAIDLFIQARCTHGIRASLAYAARHGHLEAANAFLDGGQFLCGKTTYLEGAPIVRTCLPALKLGFGLEEHSRECLEDILAYPLCEASFHGHADIIKSLLHHGANPNLAYGLALPLWDASMKGHVAAVQQLLHGGAKVDLVHTTCKGKSTALEVAVESGHLPVVKVLLEAGANPDRQVMSGETVGEDQLIKPSALVSAYLWRRTGIFELIAESMNKARQIETGEDVISGLSTEDEAEWIRYAQRSDWVQYARLQNADRSAQNP